MQQRHSFKLGMLAANVLAVLIACCLSGCTESPAATELPPPKVTVQHPEMREILEYNEYNGWTAASATVEVRARVRGHIDKVHFTDGQMVKVGDLLFELDPRPFQSEIDRAQEQLKIAESQGDVAAKDEKRTRELYERKASTLQELEQAEAVKKSWDSQIASAKEEVKRRELDLTYSRITSPIDGQIGRALLTEGNLVNAGGSDPVLTTIVQANPIEVYFSVDERALLEFREARRKKHGGELESVKDAKIPFEFGLETDSGYPHRGVIDFANNRIDPTTGTLEVRGKADNADRSFVPGGRVRIRVPTSDAFQAMLIPDTAILTDQNQKYVLRVNAEKVVVREDIEPGRLLEDGMRVIQSQADSAQDLNAQAWVIVLGLQRARINYPVDPVDANANAIASTQP